MTEWGFLIDREDWGALEPKWKPKSIKTPVPSVGEDYDTGVEPCHTEEECKERVREIQRKAMEEGRPDLPYSFLIGGDGNIYEGRGWTTQVTEPHDWHGISIGHIGHFSADHPPRLAMVYAIRDFIIYGKEHNCIKNRYEHIEVNKHKQKDAIAGDKIEKNKDNSNDNS